MPQRRRSSRAKKSGSLVGGIVRLVQVGLVLVCLMATLLVGYFGAYVWKEWHNTPDISIVERYEPIEAIQIFDINDHLVCTVEGDEDRRVIPLSMVSTQMQQAMLAAEDHHFYEHHGINLMSVVRAFLVNMQAGHVVEGGSTITQQLVKNLFFIEGQRTMQRKLKEAFLSWEIERRYSKEKILEMYLNQVYFGNGAYGIDRAASRYFNTSAANLTLAQSAFLAGLVKAPSELSASANREQAIARQREIFDKMVEYGYITEQQARRARSEQLDFKRHVNPLPRYPYYISHVLQLLRDRFSPSEMRKQGLKVYTNLDPIAQEAAEKVLSEAIKKAPKGVSQGALVSISVSDGSVLALVGGVGDFWKNQWNRATNPHTAGSSFKPFVYLTGLLKSVITPDSLIDDAPLTIKQGWGLPDWSPKNFDHKFMGKIAVRQALALSRNVCSVRIAQKVGIDNVIETARQAGITTKLDPNLSLSLGSSAVTPLDMAGAYATFARDGVSIRPRILRRIEDNRGRIIEVFEPTVNRVFQGEPVAELVDMMQGVVSHGTGTQAKLPDRPVAGKTGTADEARDIWFIGFTPDLVTAVWAGNDENQSIPGNYVTGGTIMAKIWRQYNQAYYDKHPTPPGSFIAPNKPATENVTTTPTEAPFSSLPLPAPAGQPDANNNQSLSTPDATTPNTSPEPNPSWITPSSTSPSERPSNPAQEPYQPSGLPPPSPLPVPPVPYIRPSRPAPTLMMPMPQSGTPDRSGWSQNAPINSPYDVNGMARPTHPYNYH